MVGSLLFVALGLWLALTPGNPAKVRGLGWGNVLFFGLCALAYLSDARRGRATLRLDATGLDYRHPDPREPFRSPWNRLVGVRIEHDERSSRVVLTLRSYEANPNAWSPGPMEEEEARFSPIPVETSLSPAALGTTPTELADAIERFRRYYGARG